MSLFLENTFEQTLQLECCIDICFDTPIGMLYYITTSFTDIVLKWINLNHNMDK